MATRNDPTPLDCKVYVGDLGSNGNRTEIENAFSFYGPLKEVWVARNPPGFAFVMFHDSRDARDAVRALDGKIICDRRVKVELSSGKSRHEQSTYENGHRGSGGLSRYSSRDNNDRPYTRPSSHHDSRRYGDDRGNHGCSRNHGFTRSRSRSPPMGPISRGGRPRTPSVQRSRSPNFVKSFDPSRSDHHHYGRI